MALAVISATVRRRIAYLLLVVCLNVVWPVACHSPVLPARAGLEPITPIPAARAQDSQRLLLGERLFNDRRLSHGHTHSCSSCHDTEANHPSANAHVTTE